MTIIAHRVNTIEQLHEIPSNYGVEIDVRVHDNQLVLSHDPYKSGEILSEYLRAIGDRFIIFNIKESGIEDDVLELAEQHSIVDYFLLDVEFPYLYTASRESSVRKIAIRFSEAESVETALKNSEYVDWVWVDTNTQLPLDQDTYARLTEAGYKICLVSPGRWGRQGDIEKYVNKLNNMGVTLDAVMTEVDHAEKWKQHW